MEIVKSLFYSMLLKLPHFQYLIQHVRREAENRIKFKRISISIKTLDISISI
jgi:hypothetical protein